MDTYVPSVAAHGEAELPEPKSGVRYKGSADSRLIPHPVDPTEHLVWDDSNQKVVPWEDVVAACGGEDKAKEFLQAHDFELEVIGDEFEIEGGVEFDIGGPVTD